MSKTLIHGGRVVTCDPSRSHDDNPLGAIDGAAVLLEAGRIGAIGDSAALTKAYPDATVIEHRDAVITPGLVDAHTHAVWVGSRGREYAMRMRGDDYEAIGKAGGGIKASMRAIREASVAQLTEVLCARLARMAAMGVTCVEVKSGYGLDEASERRQLEAVARAAERDDLPRVVPTFLGLHALPPEFQDREAYASACLGWLDGIARDGLARYVDAYVDRSAFSVAQARPVLERARELGLGVRLHAGQFADVGGVEMAAELGAASVDHLEHVNARAAGMLAECGGRGVLLPVASFTLGQDPPPVQRLRDAGVRLVVASDANPGTAPTESLPLAIALAVRNYGLDIAEALLGATREAAASLTPEGQGAEDQGAGDQGAGDQGAGDQGSDGGMLREGGAADLVVWDLPHEDDLAQPWGVSRARLVLRAGRELHG